MPPGDLSHYRIVEAIGRGAMGEVYRAVDRRLGREVALKLLPAELEHDPAGQDRLLHEARAASALNHPGIVTLFDLATADGCTFLVMELVIGESFSRAAQRALAWPRALGLVAAVADALAAAHALGMLHRDVKSDNLMVTAAGQVKVLDFGLAALVSELESSAPPPTLAPGADLAATVVPLGPIAATQRPDSSAFASRTRSGQVIGTPAYLAPEGYEGRLDARSEVFSLGVVLYELLTGRRPFDRPSAIATMAAIRLDDPEPPSRTAPGRAIPAAVDALALRALAKAPADRFADMTAFAAALRAAAAPVAAAPRRRRIAIAVRSRSSRSAPPPA
jgi:serine/threonine protein kinase